MSDDMRGLFFIVKGQYREGATPSFVNKANNETNYLGGYDPCDEDTEEWYMLLDCKTFHCVSCGSKFDKVLKGVYNTIIKYKGVAKKYFKHVSSITSDDYYETHYLGHTPLTPEKRAKKAEGRCPRVSPQMRCLYERIYNEYGDFFSAEIEKMEDLAYSELVEERPYKKSKKLVSKTKPQKGGVVMTKTPEEVKTTPTTLKKVKPRLNKGFKKLVMD